MLIRAILLKYNMLKYVCLFLISGIRTNNQWNPCLRNRNSTYNIKRNTSYSSPLKVS